MGGAATTGRQRKKAKGAADQDDKIPPALSRRRRILFGEDYAEALHPFELVPVEKQFREFPEDDHDLVFNKRLGMEHANDFRLKAEQTAGVDRFLRPHSIENLQLPIVTESALSRRLYILGQVGNYSELWRSPEVKMPQRPGAPGNSQLTCFELLAMYSVLRGGTESELLELLFCLFDVDQDDFVSVEDFQTTIGDFLDAQDRSKAMGHGLKGSELAAYNKIDDKAKEARQIAERALSEYGTKAAEDTQPEADKKKAESSTSAPATSSKADSDSEEEIGPKGSMKTHTGRMEDEKGEKEEKSKEKADAKAKAEAKAKTKPKRKGGCLCAGKQPRDKQDTDTETEDEKKKKLGLGESDDEDEEGEGKDKKKKEEKENKADGKEGDSDAAATGDEQQKKDEQDEDAKSDDDSDLEPAKKKRGCCSRSKSPAKDKKGTKKGEKPDESKQPEDSKKGDAKKDASKEEAKKKEDAKKEAPKAAAKKAAAKKKSTGCFPCSSAKAKKKNRTEESATAQPRAVVQLVHRELPGRPSNNA